MTSALNALGSDACMCLRRVGDAHLLMRVLRISFGRRINALVKCVER